MLFISPLKKLYGPLWMGFHCLKATEPPQGDSLLFTNNYPGILRFLNFCSNFFGHVVKQLNKKPKVNFRIYDHKNWETNNYNMHIAQNLSK